MNLNNTKIITIDSTIIIGILILSTLALFTFSGADNLMIETFKEVNKIDGEISSINNNYDLKCSLNVGKETSKINIPIRQIESYLENLPTCDELKQKEIELQILRINTLSPIYDAQLSDNFEEDISLIFFLDEITPIVTIFSSLIIIIPFSFSAIIAGNDILKKPEETGFSKLSVKLMIGGFYVLVFTIGSISLSTLILKFLI